MAFSETKKKPTNPGFIDLESVISYQKQTQLGRNRNLVLEGVSFENIILFFKLNDLYINFV